MPKKWKIYAAALWIVLAGLACSAFDETLPGDRSEPEEKWENMRSEEEFQADQGEEPSETQHAPVELSLPSECNAQGSLHIVVNQPVIKDSNYEEKCKYTVSFTNTGDKRIWVFVHETTKFFDGEIEDKWKTYYSLKPGDSIDIGCSTNFRKGDGGTTIDVITDVAPIFATEGCKNTFRNDVEPRRQISYPIFVPCD